MDSLMNFFGVQNGDGMNAQVWRDRDNEIHENAGSVEEEPLCQRI